MVGFGEYKEGFGIYVEDLGKHVEDSGICKTAGKICEGNGEYILGVGGWGGVYAVGLGKYVKIWENVWRVGEYGGATKI